MDELITTIQAAEELGISQRRVNALISEGLLPAKRFGARILLIQRADLDLVRNRPKPGRRWPAKKKGRKNAK